MSNPDESLDRLAGAAEKIAAALEGFREDNEIQVEFGLRCAHTVAHSIRESRPTKASAKGNSRISSSTLTAWSAARECTALSSRTPCTRLWKPQSKN